MSIFIGGFSRSGTSLVQGILCADPGAMPATEEASYFRGLLQAYRIGRRNWDAHTYDFFDTPEVFTEFHRELLGRYLEHLRRRYGAGRRIVLKEPALTPYFPIVSRLIADSVFVVMVRDPRDAIASKAAKIRLQHPGSERARAQHLLNDYVASYGPVLEARARLGERLLLVRYEKLVTDPEPVLAALRRLTGLVLAGDPRVTGFDVKRGDPYSRSPFDGQPVSAAAIGRYRDQLSAEDARLIEARRGPLATLFGFDVFAPATAAGGSARGG